MNMQVQFNPINLFQSRHCKDEEAFLRYSELLEAIWKKYKITQKGRILYNESLSGSHLGSQNGWG